MARALFFTMPLHGHMNPALPLVGELVARGDDVVCCSSDAFAPAIRRAGARFRPYDHPWLADLRQLPEQTHELSWLLTRASAEILERGLEDYQAERPDYVIADSVAPWGQWIGQILGVPTVTSISTFAINRQVLAFAAARGVRPRSARLLAVKLRHIMKALLLARRLQRAYRVAGPGLLGTVCGRSGLNIVYTSRAFQPRAETFDARYEFIGPSVSSRGTAADAPWNELRHPVLVYVSLGTLFNAAPAFYRACFEAFAGEDLQVVMSTGDNLPAGALGSPPPNVLVRRRVPQLQVLRRVSAFVTHGGMNSVNESLWFGVPMVVVPQMGEQALVGRRVEELGAGLHLDNDRVTPIGLREFVRRLLTEPAFRCNAQVLGESVRAAGGVARGADAVVTFTARSGRSHALGHDAR
jgi:MGT family glycosyltransferase